MNKSTYIAKTFQGLEGVLSAELQKIGATDIKPGRRAVEFSGDKAMLYKANLCLRTALRILKPIATFRATDPDQIYAKVKQMAWDKYLTPKSSFQIESTVYSDVFKHSRFVVYRVKDAIVDYFSEKTGTRPSISLTNPDLYLNLHIANDVCTLSLDSTGEPLFKRGWREVQSEASINEVLAAGMLLLAGWDGQCDFMDPMCGSGTIAIEAALIASGIAPGIFRSGFAFEKWADFDADLFEQLYNDDSGEREFKYKIFASDINRGAVEYTNRNVKRAGLSKYIEVSQADFTKSEGYAEKLLIVSNPPYGQRIGDHVEDLYAQIGTTLKHKFPKTDAWLISSNIPALQRIGLRPSDKIALFNSNLDCELRHYQMFAGKMNDYKRELGEREKSNPKYSPKPHSKSDSKHRYFKK
ncbi:MAG: class I SAM-dependent RNA methyltransferase [Paludibacteraceae bacterium]|nr:class I SAM-dependent RNA methyltransferase [Paludibacteraceae bacterium]